MTKTVVIFPWRGGIREREVSWKWVRKWWESNFDFPLFEVEHPGTEPFNRAWCINEGARRAWPWDVAILADTDAYEKNPQQIRDAVNLCLETGHMTVAHTSGRDLSRTGTLRLLSGRPFKTSHYTDQLRPICNSRINVFRADLFEELGGFDARFTGWGHEDGAVMRCCMALQGKIERVPGESVHLYHQPMYRISTRTAPYQENLKLAHRYIAAFRDPDITGNVPLGGTPESRGWFEMKEILDERTLEEKWVVPE